MAVGDLFGAQRAAEISTYALTLFRRAGGIVPPTSADLYDPALDARTPIAGP